MINCAEKKSLIEWRGLWDIKHCQGRITTLQSFVLLTLCPHSCSTRRQRTPVSPLNSATSLSLCGYVTAHLEMLTRNCARSKAKSWTKPNRCSANGATRPRRGFRSSGDWGTPRLAEHKVTRTTSQQSWATRQHGRKAESKVRGQEKEEDREETGDRELVQYI